MGLSLPGHIEEYTLTKKMIIFFALVIVGEIFIHQIN